jgi:3-methyladenine DNA glycosylase AlkD
MTVDDVLNELKLHGTEQTERTYRRHGVQGEVLGVMHDFLKRLAQQIQPNHQLAVELWSTGVHEARILCTLLAVPTMLTESDVERWSGEVHDYLQAEALGSLVAKSRLARSRLEAWVASDGEWRESAGWVILARLAESDKSLKDSFFEPYLSKIETQIHRSKNRVRHSMNMALISIGLREGPIAERALAVAKKIGHVIVDHGDTLQETPHAALFIRRTLDVRRARLGLPPERPGGVPAQSKSPNGRAVLVAPKTKHATPTKTKTRNGRATSVAPKAKARAKAKTTKGRNGRATVVAPSPKAKAPAKAKTKPRNGRASAVAPKPKQPTPTRNAPPLAQRTVAKIAPAKNKPKTAARTAQQLKVKPKSAKPNPKGPPAKHPVPKAKPAAKGKTAASIKLLKSKPKSKPALKGKGGSSRASAKSATVKRRVAARRK